MPRQSAKSPFNGGYARSLQHMDLARYQQLVRLADNVDPFELIWSSLSPSIDQLPDVNLVHIIQYLVFGIKSHTMQQMKAYKATQAHTFLTNGWVQEIRTSPLQDNKVLVLGKVKHSMRLADPPARAWVLMKKDGEILAGWCSCVAGPGEACSHVGAICYAVEFGAAKRNATSSTSRACSWLPPVMRNVPLIPVSQYDLSTPEAKRRRVLQQTNQDQEQEDVDDPQVVQRQQLSEQQQAMVMTTEQVEQLLGEIKLTDPNCALLRVSAQHSEIPLRGDEHLPAPFTDLYNEKYSEMTYEELLQVSEEKFKEIVRTKEETRLVMEATEEQSGSRAWSRQRAGKLNASEMYNLLNTSIENPGVSYIKKCCYPSECSFTTPYTEAGKEAEPIVREKYKEKMSESHVNFKIRTIGFFNVPEYPYLGASPDVLTKCDCCGKGIAEIKTRLRETNEMTFEHMYQMQTQMLLVSTYTNLPDIYCDYIIYRPNKPLYIKRIFPDEDIQKRIIEEGKVRFIRIILPELLGKYFTSLKSQMNTTNPYQTACYCQQPVRMPMAKCCNGNCTFTYFHLGCVGLSRNRKNWSQWLCPECAARQAPITL